MIRQRYRRFVIVLLCVVLLLGGASSLGADVCWFQEVGFLPVLLLRLQAQTVIWVAVTAVSAIYLLGNLAIAQRLQHPTPLSEAEGTASGMRGTARVSVPVRRRTGTLQSAAVTAPSSPLRLRSLLPLSLGCSVLIGFLVLRYGQLAVDYWQADVNLTHAAVPTLTLKTLWQFSIPQSSQLWWLGGVLMAAIALLLYPQFLVAITIGLSVLFGCVLAEQWAIALQAFHPTSFKSTEPLFGQDIAFYIFALPFWELVSLWCGGLLLYGLAAVALTYLLSGNSLSQGRFSGFSPPQQRHLYGVASGLMVAVALGYWLSQYELLYSARGVTFGASYTDVMAQLPANTVLSVVALAIAGYLLWRATFWRSKSFHRPWVAGLFSAYGVLVSVAIVAPVVVQYLVVQPNELGRERPYIERTIALTRQAFGLEAIDAKTFDPRGQLTAADLQANALTIRNIRLWDQRPLLATNRQLQQIRPYYKFLDADIDRYTLQPEAPPQKRTLPTSSQRGRLSQGGTNEQQQVLISARELDYSGVPQEAQTWVNQHLIYTHGYGFTLSPVNTVGAGGLPDYFVKDIGVTEGSTLSTSSAAIRASIPIGLPRIYYGEVADTYVMTKTNVQELDYPSGRDNVYNTYNGRGGISIGSLWRRGLFALYLKDWRMVVTRAFQPDTKLLFRRNIKQRLRTIAPFLRYDSDPYLVVANTEPGRDGDQSYLYWIVDAYTTSDRYPYSDPGSEGINYIRNSVKAVIDAYHGSVSFYIVDPTDPIITTWSAIFPTLFKPLSAMPASLRRHIRYPVDFFKLQSERLMTYHMTDPQVFYNREDQWQIPNEVYGSEARPVEPYYLITSLPTMPFEEFILLLPYTPRQRTNLIAWLAARSDGKHYGKLRLYTFPKERLVYGPEQIEARINQDPVISQQISLWNRQGSKAIQGNLLVIPIEQSLLYVEPLYLEAAQNSLPTLVRVIVAYENRIVMAPTLDEGLQAIFSPNVTPAPIVRPVEAPALSP